MLLPYWVPIPTVQVVLKNAILQKLSCLQEHKKAYIMQVSLQASSFKNNSTAVRENQSLMHSERLFQAQLGCV